jgi:hypothetical protein
MWVRERARAAHTQPLVALQRWLRSYVTLFSEPCHATGRLLAMYENGQLLVPFFRAFHAAPGRVLFAPYHEPMAVQTGV